MLLEGARLHDRSLRFLPLKLGYSTDRFGSTAAGHERLLSAQADVHKAFKRKLNRSNFIAPDQTVGLIHKW